MKKILLQIKNISKKYNENYVIKNFDLEIEKGEFVTLLGPSGCGKTTLLKLLAGFENPDSGKILANNIDIKDLKIQRRSSVTVFQDYALFPNMNVEENISYGLKIMRKPIENLSNDIYKDVDKKVKEYLKKSQSKIKSLEKSQSHLRKEIEKINKKINNDDTLFSLSKISEEEFDIKIEKIENKFMEIFNMDIYSYIPMKIKFYELINTSLFKMGINKFINYSSKEIDADKDELSLIIDLLKNKKKFRLVQELIKKIEMLENKFNDLDYWISYWQNYPDEETEWLEKKLLTRKITKEEIKNEVEKVIKLVGLEGKNKLLPQNLSGGMKQRVALARAIVIEPEILLLDEPLSALDAKVRKQMQFEIKRLHKELGITFILVTHDQEEALVLSDKIVVMDSGEIKQIGTPQDIYDRPSNVWVSKFIGQANILSGKINDKYTVNINGTNFKYSNEYKDFKINSNVEIMIRPEDFDIVNKNKSLISAKVESITYKGLLWEAKCIWNNIQLNVESIKKIEVGKTVYLSWDIEDMHLMEGENE
ncbi:MAG: ATP-binding cassette domain-containing protein [Mycoplasmoidaceae bacterium]